MDKIIKLIISILKIKNDLQVNGNKTSNTAKLEGCGKQRAYNRNTFKHKTAYIREYERVTPMTQESDLRYWGREEGEDIRKKHF